MWLLLLAEEGLLGLLTPLLLPGLDPDGVLGFEEAPGPSIAIGSGNGEGALFFLGRFSDCFAVFFGGTLRAILAFSRGFAMRSDVRTEEALLV
jgi:hypothetical protein